MVKPNPKGKQEDIMKMSELVNRDKESLTREEKKYLLTLQDTTITRLSSDEECIEIVYFHGDDSYVKTIISIDDNELPSSKEELESLVNSGKYEVEIEEF